MELVFFYINQTSSKFIEKKGFNFSANYNFNVEYFDGRYVLKQNECNVRLPEYFFDDKGCIANITAIVGENGAGKTTLLNQISNYYGSVKDKPHDLQYEEFFSQRYEEDKTIAIYLDDAKLVCYHNIDNFENETNVETIFLYQGSAELMNIVKNNRAFENVSKICLSNSMYSLEDGVSTHRSISKIALNVNSLKTLKNIFYKKKCRNVSSCAGGYYEFQDILCNAKSVNEFQQILDILYLQYIKEQNIKSVFAHNIVGNLEIKFQTFKHCLDEKFDDFAGENNKEYISYKQVMYGTKEYGQFLDLVKRSVFEREYSYVLKYIDIGGLRLASGERALLNFFSWMHLVPYFNFISNDVEESLRDNVLLLIDEIDLYCHPLWQQNLLCYLIEEVSAQYSGKNVQIIFTTHSPVVLSDMPLSNVIFLKRENNKCCIDEERYHEETFGANIYKLFNDAFFLGKKGQMGEFAKRKIKDIIDKVKPDTRNIDEVSYPTLTEEEIASLEQQIAMIGEKIVRDKLYEMLLKCKYNSLETREKKIKIYEEKIKRLKAEKMYDTN